MSPEPSGSEQDRGLRPLPGGPSRPTATILALLFLRTLDAEQVYDLQRRFKIAGGETAFRFRNDARDAAGNDTAPIFPRPRSQVDDPVRLCDGAHVMFDDYDGIAGVYEALQVLHQPVAIGGVKPRSWLVEDVDRVAALSACLLYTSPSPRDRQKSRMPSSA